MRTLFCSGERRPRKGKKLLIKYKTVDLDGNPYYVTVKTDIIISVQKVKGANGQQLYIFKTSVFRYYYQRI